jgi:membrane peptidoglycan carboxypeptidase
VRPASTYLIARRRRRRQRRFGLPTALSLFFVPIAAALGLASCAGLLGMGYVAEVSSKYPTAEEAIAARGGGAAIHDRNGTLLFRFLDEGYGIQEHVALDQMSPWLQQATIAAEDASFYSNPGISVRGITRAAVENVRPGTEFFAGSGGSSITQQLVKQIYFSPEERERRSIDRKIKEAILALRMTQKYEKDQILEWYLNEIPYGNLLVGAEAAAQGYFGIHAAELSLGQAAFLAGLPQSPAQYDPFLRYEDAKGRQAEVLDLMVRHGVIDTELRDWAMLEPIELKPAPRPFLAPHFVLYVADYLKPIVGEEALLHGGLTVWTTLDLPLQERANEILEENLLQYEDVSQGHNGAVVVINAPTGEILAMVGSRDYFRDDIAGRNNNAIALNSPGSTLKPFTYATAFMQGWGPDWPIIDSEITYTDAQGKKFTPRNPDGRTRGTIKAKEALGNSFNIPAFKTILWAGVDNVRNTAKSMGLTTLDTDLGPAMTLGGVDVTLLDLVYGYSTFANNGVMAGAPTYVSRPPGNRALDPIPVLRVTNREGAILFDATQPSYQPVIDPEYAYMITDILSNDANRQITYGRGSTLNIPGHRVAVKTGTSEPYEERKLIGDTWTVGYTPDIAVGVWVGNSDNTPMVNIASTTIAGRTWHDVMLRALEGRPARDWERPPGIVDATVCVPSGLVATQATRCRTVTGQFSAEALAQQNGGDWWGGQHIPGLGLRDDWYSRVPPGLDEVKRKLAEEYLSRYGAPARAPAPTPAPAPPPPQAPAAPPQEQQPEDEDGDDDGNDNGRGNGNGNGNGNDEDRWWE